MQLTTDRLLIREFLHSDLDALATIENHLEMRRFETGLSDREAIQGYLDAAIRQAGETPRDRYCLAITFLEEDTVIGRVTLTSQNHAIREWEIGWAVRADDQGKGYASEAALVMLTFAFQELNAHRVVAFCHTGNATSVRVMEKIGMKREGHLRQTRWFTDNWADEFVYAILDKEFKA